MFRTLLFLMLLIKIAGADCISNISDSLSTIIETAYCNSDVVFVGHIVNSIEEKNVHANLGVDVKKKEIIVYKVKIDSMLKGKDNDTLNLFCGSTIMTCYAFSPKKWPHFSLNIGDKYIVFADLAKTTTQNRKTNKNVYSFSYAFAADILDEVIFYCKVAVKNRCSQAIKEPELDTMMINQIKKDLKKTNKK